MKARTGKMVLVFLVVLAGGASLATAATALVGVNANDGYNNFPGCSCGWQFTPQADIKVTKLGYWAGLVNSLSNSATVTIYDSAGNAKVSATIPAGDVSAIKEDAYAYMDVAAQNAVLTGGQTYIIASYWEMVSGWNYDVQYTSTWSAGSGLITIANDPVNPLYKQVDFMATGQTMPIDMGGTWNTLLSANFQFELVPSVVPVLIDIKPGTDPNPINQGSNGVIPVAILTTLEFDAADIDPTTVSLNGATVAVRGKSANLLARMEDVDGDGDADLLCQVDTECWEALGESGDVKLTGNTRDGVAIEGWDSVIIVPPLP